MDSFDLSLCGTSLLGMSEMKILGSKGNSRIAEVQENDGQTTLNPCL